MVRKKAGNGLDGREVLESLGSKGGKQGKNGKTPGTKGGKNARSKKQAGAASKPGAQASVSGKGSFASRLAHGAASLAAKPASAVAGLLVRTLTCLCLAFSLFGAGLLVCSSKEATQAIGQTFSGWSDSTLPADDMAAIAEEVRLFSMGQASTDDLKETTIEHVKKSYPEVAQVLETGSLAAGLAEDAAKAAGAANGAAGTASDDGPASPIVGTNSTGNGGGSLGSQITNALGLPDSYSTSGSITTAKIDSWFSLPENAVSHLADCIPVFVTAQGATVFAAIAALAGLVWLGVCRGRKAVGQTMILGACVPLTLLLAIGLWALVDFDGLFAAMHGLFFSAGTWTFPNDSLLIRLFPEAFWAAMAGLWAAVSIGLSLLCLAIGRLVRKGAK